MAADWVVTFFDLDLEAASGVRVGVGRGGAADSTDLPLMRDPFWRPIIPGSSLKGVLRSAAERLLRGVDPRLACDILVEDVRSENKRCLAGKQTVEPDDLRSLCWMCRLFGNPFQAGRLTAFDLVADRTETVVRDGVAIDRGELKAKDGAKYDYEVSPPGTIYRGRLRLDDPEPGEVGLVVTLLDLLDEGVVTVGGGASRGLGRLRFRTPPTVTQFRASAFVPGSPPSVVDVAAERAAFAARLEGAK